jgi:hypothetical protein
VVGRMDLYISNGEIGRRERVEAVAELYWVDGVRLLESHTSPAVSGSFESLAGLSVGNDIPRDMYVARA